MRPRVLGRNVTLLVNSAKWLAPIALGELEEFTATSTTEMIKSRPVGFSLQAATLRYGGYDLSFKIAKTDPFMARWAYLVDRGLISGTQPPELFIFETIQHYDRLIPGTSIDIPTPFGTFDANAIRETWIYKNVTLYGPDFSISAQDMYEHNIKGFAAYKELGPIGTDTTILKLEWIPQLGFQEIVIKTGNVEGGIVEDITSAINSALNSPKKEEPKNLLDSNSNFA
jgi:hypothetical protein